MITYKWPNKLALLLINYKTIAHQLNADESISYPCGKCMLGDQGGNKGMVKITNSLKLETGKTTKLKKKLKL